MNTLITPTVALQRYGPLPALTVSSAGVLLAMPRLFLSPERVFHTLSGEFVVAQLNEFTSDCVSICYTRRGKVSQVVL